MQPFKADIVIKNKKGKWLFAGGVILVSALLILLMALGFIPVLGQLLWVMIFLVSITRYFLQTKKQVIKKKITELVIDADFIMIGDEKILLQDIKEVKIFISGWKSYKRSEERYQPVSDVHLGDKNLITLNMAGKNQTFEFMLHSKEHWSLLRLHVISWYRRNIKITESNPAGKSYGLEALMYAQIQGFKKLIANPNTTE